MEDVQMETETGIQMERVKIRVGEGGERGTWVNGGIVPGWRGLVECRQSLDARWPGWPQPGQRLGPGGGGSDGAGRRGRGRTTSPSSSRSGPRPAPLAPRERLAGPLGRGGRRRGWRAVGFPASPGRGDAGWPARVQPGRAGARGIG